jgi:hypothetical protein
VQIVKTFIFFNILEGLIFRFSGDNTDPDFNYLTLQFFLEEIF